MKLFPEVKFSKNLFIGLGYTLNDIRVPQGKFKARTVNRRVNYSFSNKLLTSVTVTSNSLNHLADAKPPEPGTKLRLLGRTQNLVPMSSSLTIILHYREAERERDGNDTEYA